MNQPIGNKNNIQARSLGALGRAQEPSPLNKKFAQTCCGKEANVSFSGLIDMVDEDIFQTLVFNRPAGDELRELAADILTLLLEPDRAILDKAGGEREQGDFVYLWDKDSEIQKIDYDDYRGDAHDQEFHALAPLESITAAIGKHFNLYKRNHSYTLDGAVKDLLCDQSGESQVDIFKNRKEGGDVSNELRLFGGTLTLLQEKLKVFDELLANSGEAGLEGIKKYRMKIQL